MRGVPLAAAGMLPFIRLDRGFGEGLPTLYTLIVRASMSSPQFEMLKIHQGGGSIVHSHCFCAVSLHSVGSSILYVRSS